jgi:hypothetical protein
MNAEGEDARSGAAAGAAEGVRAANRIKQESRLLIGIID